MDKHEKYMESLRQQHADELAALRHEIERDKQRLADVKARLAEIQADSEFWKRATELNSHITH